MAFRSLLVVLPLAHIGLRVLDSVTFTSVACLAALWIVLADFRRPAVHGYVATAAGVVVATAIGSIPMPSWLTVVTVALCTAWLGLWRGFGGFAANAGITVSSALLVGVGLRVAGQDPVMVVLGALAGASCAAVVGIAFASKQRKILQAAHRARSRLVHVLDGELPDSEAAGVSREMLTSYVKSSDRPQAPTKKSSSFVTRLSAMSRIGDLLGQGVARDDVEIRKACGRRLAGGTEKVHYDGDDLGTLALVSATELVINPPAISRGEWSRQLKVRLRPDSMLFTQTLSVGVLYGSLTALVLFGQFSHPHWVLLGAVSASYPYARQAAFVVGNMLLATVLAFVVLFGVAWLSDAFPQVWWLLLVVSITTASGATSTRLGKLIGQTSFTVLSLCLLAINLGGVSGRDAEIRFEDVVVGGLAALLIALVLAPRHLRERFETALSGMLIAGAHGLNDPATGLELCRAQFLRCTDAMESIRGTKSITTEHLVSWLDAARNVVQLVVAASVAQEAGVDAGRQNEAAAEECRRRAGELDDDAGITAFVPPEAHSAQEAQLRSAYAWLFETQLEELSNLTPLIPRERLQGHH